jgi:hypothetical protein
MKHTGPLSILDFTKRPSVRDIRKLLEAISMLDGQYRSQLKRVVELMIDIQNDPESKPGNRLARLFTQLGKHKKYLEQKINEGLK